MRSPQSLLFSKLNQPTQLPQPFFTELTTYSILHQFKGDGYQRLSPSPAYSEQAPGNQVSAQAGGFYQTQNAFSFQYKLHMI